MAEPVATPSAPVRHDEPMAGSDATSGAASPVSPGHDAGAAGGTDDGAEVLYTIDELAAQSGVPSRTIRYYQSKGTLPSPERRGRVAYYRVEHIERLRVIAELQDRGLRLDAIGDVLQRLEEGGDSLQDWLGMGDQLQAPWSDDRPIVLSEPDLLDRVGNRRPGILAELSRLGLIERQGNSRPAMYIVPSPGLLDVNLELDSAKVDSMVAGEAGELMRKRMARLADELVTFFAERAGDGFGGAGEPEEIVRSFAALRPEGMRAIQLFFAQEMERALRQFVERGGTIPPKPRSRDTGSGGRTDRKSDRKGHRRPDRRSEDTRDPEAAS
jgi:DNA-binding transcriptional MerR regulator